jgi:hypothetical protein
MSHRASAPRVRQPHARSPGRAAAGQTRLLTGLLGPAQRPARGARGLRPRPSASRATGLRPVESGACTRALAGAPSPGGLCAPVRQPRRNVRARGARGSMRATCQALVAVTKQGVPHGREARRAGPPAFAACRRQPTITSGTLHCLAQARERAFAAPSALRLWPPTRACVLSSRAERRSACAPSMAARQAPCPHSAGYPSSYKH